MVYLNENGKQKGKENVMKISEENGEQLGEYIGEEEGKMGLGNINHRCKLQLTLFRFKQIKKIYY